MIEWSNDQVLKFLELYATERLLWDPSHKDHKKKHKVHDAWKRISENLENTPTEELKSLLKKKKVSIRSGAGADEVFQPIWFAFDAMESFLGTIYNVEDTINTEADPEQTDEVASLTQDTERTEENEEEKGEENITNRKTAEDKSSSFEKKAYRSRSDAELAQKQLNDSFKTLNQVLQSKHGNLEDDCDLYGKLLARKLRRYPEHPRQRIMYKIDGLLLDNPPESSSYTPFSSSSASRPSSAYTPQELFVYPQHSQPFPVYSHDSQASGYSQPSVYSQHSQPSPVDSHHYQRTSTYAPSSQLSPLNVQVLQAPLQKTSRTTPCSSHYLNNE